MKRIARGAVVLATIPLLLVGMAAAAVAGGTGITTTRPFSDGSWRPGVQQGSGVSTMTMRPFSDPNYPIAVGATSGVSTMRPFSDPNWTPAGKPKVTTMRPFSDPGYPFPAGQPKVISMRPFSDPNDPIHAQPMSRGMQPENPGGALPLVALAVGLTALAAAAAAWAAIGRRQRLRTA
jgi:hypothetical protein